MLHTLTEWEINGYDDSDFMATVWDDEANIVKAIEVGSTRYAGGIQTPPPIADPKLLDLAIQWLADAIFKQIRAAEDNDVLTPNDAALGADLRLTRSCKHKGETIPAGSVGRVFWCGAYGKFYRNGYNRPGRANRRVGLELTTGQKVFVALSACRLDKEPESDESLRARSAELAQNCRFSAVFPRYTWDSHNYAAALKKSLNG